MPFLFVVFSCFDDMVAYFFFSYSLYFVSNEWSLVRRPSDNILPAEL